MNDVIVSVGMGPGQVEFIKRLKELNYIVVAFGKGKNSEEAKYLADYSKEIDTRDIEGAIEWIESLEVNVIAVGSYAGGIAVQTVQKLSNYFHTPTEIPEEFIVGADKIYQQKLYEKFGLSTIRTWRLTELTTKEVENIDEDLFILKPEIGRGSEGIKFCKKRELVKYLSDSSEFNKQDIIQVVHEGTEYRCVIVVQNGELKLLAPIRRISYRDTVFLGILNFSNEHKKELETFIKRFVKLAKLKNVILKADIIVSKTNIDVIEMDIGVGGGNYYKTFVSEVYGRNLMDEYIRLITNQKIEKFNVLKPDLRMEYVFNRTGHPVYYDIDRCRQLLYEKIGSCEIIVNRLHPESKSYYNSNADFLFTVIYNGKKLKNAETFFVDTFVNDQVLEKAD